MPALLSELTYVEARELLAREPVVLVPVGSTEAHGPHLPLGTDVIISEELARRAALALETGSPPLATVTAPPLAYTVTEYAAEFTGTVSVSAAAARTLLAEICRDLHRQGFRRLCLVSSHLEPAHAAALREVAAGTSAAGAPAIAFPDVLEPRWARTLSDEFKRGACHAGRYETSLVLAARPDLVRNLLRARLPARDIDLPALIAAGARSFREAGADDAYFGDPAAASADEGRLLYGKLVEMVVTVVRETWR